MSPQNRPPRILIFGGSFDPPHRGHAALLDAAIKTLRPDRTYLIPAYHSPLKAPSQASIKDRMFMTRLMIQNLRVKTSSIHVDPFELRRNKKTFTYQTLNYFKKRHPRAEFWFLAGSDALAQFSKWKRAGELRKSCRWATGLRAGSSTTLPNLPGLLRLQGRFPPWSSTEIRSRLSAGLDIRHQVIPAVLRYIEKKKLYRLDIHRELRKTLNEHRYRHTLGVAQLALELALKHGYDPESAALAGLLHDCGRKFDMRKMVGYARQHRLSVPHLKEIINRAPILLHAFISANIAKRTFGVRDPRILSAIQNHTLGRAGMNTLDRLVYVADIASGDRSFPEAARIRRISKRNLNLALRTAIQTKIRYVRKNGEWLHPDTARFLAWTKTL